MVLTAYKTRFYIFFLYKIPGLSAHLQFGPHLQSAPHFSSPSPQFSGTIEKKKLNDTWLQLILHSALIIMSLFLQNISVVRAKSTTLSTQKRIIVTLDADLK